MDYESRKVKWYWFLLFTIYCGVVVYMLFQNNPFLYSRQELRTALDVGEAVHKQTVPLHPEPAKASAATFAFRYNPQHSAIDPGTGPRSKNYEEYEHNAVDLSDTGLDAPYVTQDSSGIFLSGKSPWVVALGIDGKVRWKYRFKDVPLGRSIQPVLLDESSAYIIHPMGEVVCLDKVSGEIRWVLSTKEELAATPLLWKKTLILPAVSTASGVQLVFIDRATGKLDEETQHLDVKPGFQLSEAPELKALIATVDNKVIAIDPDEWAVQWSLTLTDPVKGAAVVVGTQIYAATLAAKVVKIDGAKKGKLEWEADIIKPPASPPSFLPVVNRLAVLDTSGYLSEIDAKSGKVFWRIPTENHNPLVETWSARLKGAHIEEFKMDWLQKGWTTWSPCYENSFCIYTPKSGLITRVHLSGRPMALPLAYERRWVFLSQTKPGHYVVSQVIETQEIKKLKAENAK
ncbi:MAG: outer membrane protein assembly factor BamB family protein [Bdellovibrionales bacterium]